MAEPLPPVEIRFRAGPGMDIDVTDARCGLAIAPNEVDGRFLMSVIGTDAEIIQMALGVVGYVRLCGLEHALMVSLAHGVGMDSTELRSEQMYEVPPPQED